MLAPTLGSPKKQARASWALCRGSHSIWAPQLWLGAAIFSLYGHQLHFFCSAAEFRALRDTSKCSLASTLAPVKGRICTAASPHHGPIP